MLTFLKRFIFVLLILLLLVQFYPKGNKNISQTLSAADISTKYNVPADVQTVLKASCYDCHSNNTVYPWYYKVQPVAWWLNEDIKDAKKEVNFSEFASYRAAKQFRKLKEIKDEVEGGDMPLPSYTFIHRYARLDETQKKLVINWATSIQDSLKAHYPADSLVIKKPV